MSEGKAEELIRDGVKIRRGPYPEFTWTAVLVGWVIGALIAVSIGYAALILGFSIEGSELAAILGWGILRGLMGRTSIVENNINQTIASAVNGASSGIMFSVPALFILSQTDGFESVGNFNIPLMILSCVTGCVLGLAFVIPLRKQMIDFDRLAFPGGIAVATILKSPGAGVRKATLLLGGALLSGVVNLLVLNVLGTEDWHAGDQFGIPAMFNITLFLSIMTIGVGFLSGKGGFWFGAGGFICYWVLAPLLGAFGDPSTYELVDPPIRSAIVTTDNQKSIKRTIKDLNKLDESSAAAIIAATGYDPAATDEKKGASDATDADVQPTQTTVADLFDTARAQAIFDTARDLWEKSKTAPDEKTRIGLLKASKTLITKTRAIEILDASRLLTEVDDGFASDFKAAVTSKELLDILDASSLEPEQKATLDSASWASDRYHGSPNQLRLQLFRPTGIGMLIGAAIGGIIAALPLIMSAFQSMHSASQQKSSNGSIQNDEMPITLLYLAVIVGAVVLIVIAFTSVPDMTFGRAALMALLGTAWVWVAGVIVAECIGRTNWSPLSGMTLIAVTIIILIAKSGLDDSQAIMSSMMVGAAICLAISQASDMMLDLKSGYLVGAIPRRQQMAQFVGAWLGPCIVIFLMILLNNQYEIGSDRLPAPQAQALASVTEGIMTDDVPSYRYLSGIGLGGLLAFSGLGGIGVLVGLGFYMPFNIVLTYTIGNVLRIVSDNLVSHKFSHEIGIPIAAGFIVGEALVGVGNALYQVAFAKPPSYEMLDKIFDVASTAMIMF